MKNNKQQTAVEWYIEKLLDLDYEYAKGLITLGVWSERKKSLIEQAKEMEKNQIMDANEDLSTANGLEYYNQTFGDESNP